MSHTDLFECIVFESLLETSMYLEFEKANCNYLKELNLNSSTRLSLFGVSLNVIWIGDLPVSVSAIFIDNGPVFKVCMS